MGFWGIQLNIMKITSGVSITSDGTSMRKQTRTLSISNVLFFVLYRLMPFGNFYMQGSEIWPGIVLGLLFDSGFFFFFGCGGGGFF